jgi:hypothetical protein
MSRFIDEFNQEWDPNAFSGKRYHPTTEFKYITPIATRASLIQKGVAIPRRMA